MRSEVQVLLDPPLCRCEAASGIAPARREAKRRGLSSVGRAPALQAGCHRFESVRLHHPFDMIRQHGVPGGNGGSVSSCRTSASREAFYIVQRDNQRCRPHPREDVVAIFGSANGDVVQVKYTNQMRPSCMGPAQNVPSGWKGRETYMLLIGSDRRAQQKGAARKTLRLSSSGSNQAR